MGLYLIQDGVLMCSISEDGSIIFEAEVAGTEEIKYWIMSWGEEALVLEPESLRDEIRMTAQTMLERYDREMEGEEKTFKV